MHSRNLAFQHRLTSCVETPLCAQQATTIARSEHHQIIYSAICNYSVYIFLKREQTLGGALVRGSDLGLLASAAWLYFQRPTHNVKELVNS